MKSNFIVLSDHENMGVDTKFVVFRHELAELL